MSMWKSHIKAFVCVQLLFVIYVSSVYGFSPQTWNRHRTTSTTTTTTTVPFRKTAQSCIRTITHLSLMKDGQNGQEEENEDDIEFSYEKGYIYKKKKNVYKKGDNRESLPFVVTMSESEEMIGTYLLDATTSCGDLLDLRGKIFEVKRVAFLYRYESGGFRVFKKKLGVDLAKAAWLQPENGNDSFLQ